MIDKRTQWCIDNIPSFAEMYNKTQTVRKEERENRESFERKAKKEAYRKVRRG